MKTIQVQNVVHIAAGSMILIGLIGAHLSGQVNLLTPTWLWLSAFVGANLFQYGFTNFCPMVIMLKKFGVKDGCCTKSESKNKECCGVSKSA